MEKTIEIEEPKSSNRGFTLIELLIVIVILGILAAVTVFAVRGITDKGTTSACASDKATIATAVESYFAQYGGTEIPYTTAGPTVVHGTAPAGVTPGLLPDVTLVNAGFLRSVSTKYTIATTGTGGAADGKTLTPVSGSGCT